MFPNKGLPFFSSDNTEDSAILAAPYEEYEYGKEWSPPPPSPSPTLEGVGKSVSAHLQEAATTLFVGVKTVYA
tara:strand:- start:63 stop:281 length:219 start_codon:yes stop_codon:yes gene_type:complete